MGQNAFYQLFVSDTPMSWPTSTVCRNGSLVIPMVEAINGSRTLTVSPALHLRQTFYLASFPGAEVLGEGEANFWVPRTSAPRRQAGDLVGESGTTYALASSVPEPTPVALLALGLAGCLHREGRSAARRCFAAHRQSALERGLLTRRPARGATRRP